MNFTVKLRLLRIKRTIALSPLLILLSMLASPANAEVYKWTDERGNVVYGDKPQSSEAKQVIIKKSPGADSDYNERLMKRKKILDVFQEERQEKKEQQQQAAAEKAERQKECTRLIAELQDMQSASYLYEDTDDPLNPRIVSDQERQQEEKKYQDYIDKNCK